ncbi:acyl-CoA dehydrogenase [Streptomyces xanthochromogenes]|uniref:acyl-CoA dehydrogenase family protein n=1 Tax=Streptomyces xanthochromogenes TaxID=67384 RepID=UPI00167740B5|nr:acyl-CoA dehydrogenase family protein [Streptomyces xanthochromogenes]GHB38182.1 acyl-CoA dehydrogenase [Streptomyces xanthochromogenes]
MTAQTAEEATPDLLYSEAEDDLRAAVRSLLADRTDTPAALARAESDTPCDRELWRALGAGMELAGLLVPEKLGGQGASHREAAVVLEEIGRSVAPVPFLTSAVMATETLLALGDANEEVASLVRELASGHRTAALVVPFSAGPYAVRLPETLTGTVSAVADAATADVLLVPTGEGLYAVDAAEATVVALTPLDLTRPLAAVSLDGLRGTLLAGPDATLAAVRRGLLAGAGLLASEQLGVAEWCLTETVSYTRERKQFNRPVGSFQALKHRMAQLWLEVVSARAAARNAADALATGSPEAPLAAAVAQAYCARVAVHAAEECVQLHGGIGMTWEHPAHLYLKRAKSAQIALGSAGEHRAGIADLVDLRAP